MRFYVGLHHPSDARYFERACISVNSLRKRKSSILCSEWIMDSGAFTELSTYGLYRHSVDEYAKEISRWRNDGVVAAVSQDYMCEPYIIEKTGLDILTHQILTIRRYDVLRSLVRDVYIMPVIQGYKTADYLSHMLQYEDRLKYGMWVGIGSVCKRNSDVGEIEEILLSIVAHRPDLYLHGFGIKITSLRSSIVRNRLFSADSMAWSYAARREGRNPNDRREAQQFVSRINKIVEG